MPPFLVDARRDTNAREIERLEARLQEAEAAAAKDREAAAAEADRLRSAHAAAESRAAGLSRDLEAAQQAAAEQAKKAKQDRWGICRSSPAASAARRPSCP